MDSSTKLILFSACFSVLCYLCYLYGRSKPIPTQPERDLRSFGASGRSLAGISAGLVAEPYRVYSDAHDVEVQADMLMEEIFPDKTVRNSHYALFKSNSELRQAEMREFYRLAPELTNVISEYKRLDYLITVLTDNSGSIRGHPAAELASAITVLGREFDKNGLSFEVLGFTTRNWKGGLSRKQWISEGRPQLPGRLCDLMHIVYKPHDQLFAETQEGLAILSYADVLRENIDGEALLWAHRRFRASGFKRWLCIVVSDGAPVDDSTLMSNHPNFLADHIRAVAAEINVEPLARVVGLGHGHKADHYYGISEFAENGDYLVPKIVGILRDALQPAGQG